MNGEEDEDLFLSAVAWLWWGRAAGAARELTSDLNVGQKKDDDARNCSLMYIFN